MRRKRRGGKAVKHLLHLLRLTAFTAGLILLLALFHLVTIGVPAPLTRHITARLQAQGIPLQIGSITLSPRRGWVLHNPRLYSTSPDDLTPILQTKQLACRIWPKDWSNLKESAWDVSIRGIDIAIRPGRQWESFFPKPGPFRSLGRLQADLTVDSRQLTINYSEIQWGTVRFSAAGHAVFPATATPLTPGLMDQIEHVANQVTEALRDTSIIGASELNLKFDLPEAGLKKSSARAIFLIPGLRRNNLTYKDINGTVSLSDETLHLDALHITAEDENKLTLSGKWTLPERIIEASLTNSMPAADLLNLLPNPLAEQVEQAGIQRSGPLTFNAQIGPATADKILEQIHLNLQAVNVTRNGLDLNPLQFNLVRSGNQINIRNIETTIHGAPASGAFEMDLQARSWNASYKGKVPLDVVSDLLDATSQKWIDRFEFTGGLPDIDGQVTKEGNDDKLQLLADISASNGLCEGIPFETFSTTMSYSNRTFSLAPLRMSDGDKHFEGTIRVELAEKLAHFEIESSFAPPVITHILKLDAPDILTNLTYTGPVFCTGSGRVDYSGGTNHDVQGTLSATNVLISGLAAETLDTTILYTNRTCSLTPLRISVGDKFFNGNVRLELAEKLVLFDAESSLAPPIIAQILLPNRPTVLTNFTFNGPVFSKGAGQIDFSGGTNHAATGMLEAAEVSAARLTARNFKSRIEAYGDQLLFSEGKADMFDGTADGAAIFDLCLKNQESPYKIDLNLTDMDLSRIAQYINTNDTENTRGRVTASINLQADASTNFWDSATGNGVVKIDQGQLADLPILGGFSSLLRTTLPGFSLFSLTTLYAEYDLHDGKLHSDRIELGGTLLSTRGHGTYSPKTGLDFTAQAELLRQTRKNKKWYQLHLWLADALKGGTAPLFFLLEFKLTGPLDNPNWQLVNLPKEISDLLKVPGALLGTGNKRSSENTH
jgi:hypothetical protein